jgi:hypothetical protein
MDRKQCIVVMLIAVISLIVFNLGTRHQDSADSREISGYEYEKLHNVASLYSEVTEGVEEDLKHERLTIAEYNKIMRKYDRICSQQEQKARQQMRSRVAVASYGEH